jgi:lipoprotein NlpD
MIRLVPTLGRVLPLSLLVSLALAGCTLRSVREAPIVDKSRPPAGAPSTAPATAAAAPPAPPAARTATDGTYVVQRGDTLYSIAVAFGQDYRDLARWNRLDDPSKLAVGQTLRVVPPEGESAGVVVGVVAVNPSAATETRPLEPTPLPAPPPAAAPTPPPAATASPAPKAQEPTTPKPAPTDSGLLWQWPAAGKVIEPFAEGRNKGIGIGGAEGDPVLAAGDGEVVYSGNGLRGYGNLVIIKHSDDFISAYGHNRQILVKQGQTVRRGQKIAELGKTDTTTPKLHFEIRHRGKPVDPLRLLPPR